MLSTRKALAERLEDKPDFTCLDVLSVTDCRGRLKQVRLYPAENVSQLWGSSQGGKFGFFQDEKAASCGDKMRKTW